MNWIKQLRQAIAGGSLIIAPFSWFWPSPPPDKPAIEIQDLSIRGECPGATRLREWSGALREMSFRHAKQNRDTQDAQRKSGNCVELVGARRS